MLPAVTLIGGVWAGLEEGGLWHNLVAGVCGLLTFIGPVACLLGGGAYEIVSPRLT